MPYYHVKNKENKWNLFSSIVDDYIFDDFSTFEEHKKRCIDREINKYSKELDTLLCVETELNVMSYEFAERSRNK